MTSKKIGFSKPPSPHPVNMQRVQHTSVKHSLIKYKSPLPPPEILDGYNQINKDLLPKVIELIEKEGTHRRELQERKLTSDISSLERRDAEAQRGQIFAFGILVIAIIGAVITATQGHPIPAGVISLVGLSGIVGSFINGRIDNKTTASDSSPALTPETIP